MRTLAVLIMLVGSVSVALADNDSGLYLGAGVGTFKLKARDITSGAAANINTEFDSDDTAFKGFAGWRFNRFIGIEAAYIDFGKPNQDYGTTQVEARINGFAPYLTGTLPLGPIEFFVKAGYLFYDLTIKAGGQKIDAASGSHEDLIGGGGIGITLFGHLHADIEYEHLDAAKANRSDAVWLSGAWRF